MQNDAGKIKGIEGTAYAMLQACTQWVDHQRDGLKCGNRNLNAVRAESAMFGTGDIFKNQALDSIYEIMGLNDVEKVPDRINSIANQVQFN